MKKRRILSIALALGIVGMAVAQNPKREFRGAWLHTVFQEQYHKQSTAENKAYLTDQLDKLKAAGVNAVIFQVRPQADAFYPSKLEPWSRFLTDGGKAPEPFWDPLQFMIDECHSRGLELHAWLNPYRVTTSAKQTLPKGHIYHSHPERFLKYGGQTYFDPGLPENREFIIDVVDDIVSRYDVDGIHFDDYFYPYPKKGENFPDDASYAKYGKGMARDDWRRQNVDILIRDIHSRIQERKPWVRFGISPFGIWRNKKNDPRGSETNGLENYGDLYADVLLWENEGWIDYVLPQLYWELEHKAASYLVLNEWWNANAGKKRHLYIGQDVGRTMTKPDLAPSADASQLNHKIRLTREAENIKGNCWWPGYSLTANKGGIADSLSANQQASPALVPAYPWISQSRPAAVSGLEATADNTLRWQAPKPEGRTADVVRFVVYRFDSEDSLDMDNADNIVEITGRSEYSPALPGVYTVTAIDRANNESLPCNPVVIKR